MNIESLINQFKNMEEMKVFCSSQLKQILNLTKKIKELEDENKELKKGNSQVNNLSFINNKPLDLSILGAKALEDAEIIAHVQLKRLKEVSYDKELTLEEAKRVEIYNRILKAPDEKDKPLKANSRVIPDNELLSLVSEVTSGTNV